MGKGVQATEAVGPQDHAAELGHHPSACRRPPGRKPGPAPDYETYGRQLWALIRHCFPELLGWLNELPDPRVQELCVYLGRHLWMQPVLMFLLRDGSRNAFDADRNTGQLPENLTRLCGQRWDESRLGKRRTVTCSQNVIRHLNRVPVEEVGQLLIRMVRRLMQMRMLDKARLLDRWWLIVIDGTLQDRGRKTPHGQPRYRYVVEAKLVGPQGTMFSLMTEFMDMHDPIRQKDDCELNAFLRLSERLHAQFPRLPICLILDGLYPVESVFDRCEAYGWKLVATHREGRQPIAWDEAVQTMMMSPSLVARAYRMGEDGQVDQTLRWTHQVPFGRHDFQVLFCGEISPTSATLWVWVTNFRLTPRNVLAIANRGGRSRQGIENVFNVEKNGGFGLEHAFCAQPQAAKNYHLLMQVAHILEQLLVNGLFRRLTQTCRKLTDRKLIELLRTSLLTVPIDQTLPAFGQIRFRSSA
jgi:hypothetical protein